MKVQISVCVDSSAIGRFKIYMNIYRIETFWKKNPTNSVYFSHMTIDAQHLNFSEVIKNIRSKENVRLFSVMMPFSVSAL